MCWKNACSIQQICRVSAPFVVTSSFLFWCSRQWFETQKRQEDCMVQLRLAQTKHQKINFTLKWKHFQAEGKHSGEPEWNLISFVKRHCWFYQRCFALPFCTFEGHSLWGMLNEVLSFFLNTSFIQGACLTLMSESFLESCWNQTLRVRWQLAPVVQNCWLKLRKLGPWKFCSQRDFSSRVWPQTPSRLQTHADGAGWQAWVGRLRWGENLCFFPFL